MDSIPSNSDNMRTVKHLSENQKQKAQHQEKQEKLLETVGQTIKETDPPQKGNRSNTNKTKNSKRQL